MLKVIFRTPKGSDTPKIVGQTSKTKRKDEIPIVEKVTGERVQNITHKGDTTTGVTKSYNVDLVDKESLGGGVPD